MGIAVVGMAVVGIAAWVLGACASPPAVRGSAAGTEATKAIGPGGPGTAATVESFTGTIGSVTAADVPASWRSGCPVGPADLRLLRMSYWGFDSRPHEGTMVVHASVAETVLGVFRRLYDRRFPIRRMELVDAFGGSDDASMAADNTAGFNCRKAVSSGAPRWSAHAYGQAVDVNPVENPYVLDGAVLPPMGADFANRSDIRPGMALRDGELTAAFSAVGWAWGGLWASPDHQHFSATGN